MVRRAACIASALVAALFSGCTTEGDPIECRPASQPVGPEGGTLRLGPLTVAVPAGALEATIALTAACDERPLPDGMVARSRVYRLGPEGTEFALPVVVTILASGAPADAAIFWSAPGAPDELELAPTTRAGDAFTAEGTHFSSTVVGSRPVACGLDWCQPTEHPCRSRTASTVALPWCPGDSMPSAGPGAELAVMGPRDESRLQDLRAAVREGAADPPACLADLVSDGLQRFDPVSPCAAGRNPREARWVTPELREAIVALRDAVRAHPDLGPGWDVHLNGAMGTCRDATSMHAFGAAADLALCEVSGAACVKRHDRYGLLAALAWQTGLFNFVWYEDYNHVHASRYSPSTMGSVGSACTPSARCGVYCEPPCTFQRGTEQRSGRCTSPERCAASGRGLEPAICPGTPGFDCCAGLCELCFPYEVCVEHLDGSVGCEGSCADNTDCTTRCCATLEGGGGFCAAAEACDPCDLCVTGDICLRYEDGTTECALPCGTDGDCPTGCCVLLEDGGRACRRAEGCPVCRHCDEGETCVSLDDTGAVVNCGTECGPGGTCAVGTCTPLEGGGQVCLDESRAVCDHVACDVACGTNGGVCCGDSCRCCGSACPAC